MKLVQIPSFMSIGTTDIEFREFKEKKKKKNKMGKIIKFLFSSNMKRKWYFSEIFNTQFFLLCCKVIRSRIDLKLKVKTEFS